MTPLTKEWVAKAEGDYNAALTLYRARKAPNYDLTAYHAQQCAEKYMKAVLQEAGVNFPKTHDLAKLLDLLLPKHPLWTASRGELDLLSKTAVEVRYPGRTVQKKDAKEMRVICEKVREQCRGILGLK